MLWLTRNSKSELGLNPQVDGQLMRLPVPDLVKKNWNEKSSKIYGWEMQGFSKILEEKQMMS